MRKPISIRFDMIKNVNVKLDTWSLLTQKKAEYAANGIAKCFSEIIKEALSK